MKDKQIAPASTEPRIFLVSAVLHCVSMTALVYLRSSFGFGYLRPKSVFFAFTWAFILFCVYAWIDDMAWREHRALIFFGLGAVTLYWLHLAVAFFREWRESGEHEQFSGASHLVRLARWIGAKASERFENGLRLWGEPAAVLACAAIIRWRFGERHLCRWLCFVAGCLWLKEILNQWFSRRTRKRQKDLFSETEEATALDPAAATLAPPSTGARRAKVKRTRNGSG